MKKKKKTGGREKNMVNLSKNFFNKVIKNERYFKTVSLTPPHPEFRERIEQLEHLVTILKRYNSCPKIIDAIENDIKVLPDKKLKMVDLQLKKLKTLSKIKDKHTLINGKSPLIKKGYIIMK